MTAGARMKSSLLGCAALAACSTSTRLNVGPLPSGVTVDANVAYYDITAATLVELRRGMQQHGPRWEGRAWSATTQSHFRWTYQYERRGVHCELRRVRVQVRTIVTFPRWNPTAPPDSATLEWWHQLNAGLMEHERGHALLSVKTAGEIASAFERLSHPQCDALGELANRTGRDLISREREKQVEYDRTTRHGGTQIIQAARLLAP